MNSASHTVFSVHMGALLALIVASAYDGFVRQSRPSRGAMGYFVLCVLTSLVGSGWVEATFGVRAGSGLADALAWLFAVLVMATALAGLSGSRRWLGFPWRGPGLDRAMRAMQRMLQLGLAVAAAGMLVEIFLAQPLTPYLSAITWAAGGLSVTTLFVCAYVCYRMAQLSDRLSLWLTWATVLTAPGIAALVLQRATDAQLAPALWAFLTAAHALAMLCTANAALQQNLMHNARHHAEADADNFDALDRAALGERLADVFTPKFDRLHQSSVTPAVIVVNVFNHDDIAQHHGLAAADQVTLATLARLRSVLNPHDALARYFDACFVVLIRAQVDTHYLREVCLRLAASVRRDVALRGLTALQNDNTPMELDVGVGLCWSDRVAQFSEALGQAGAAASAARDEASKASVVLYPGKPPLPVEAVLGGHTRAVPSQHAPLE